MNKTSNCVIASWEVPQYPGGIITRYKVSYEVSSKQLGTVYKLINRFLNLPTSSKVVGSNVMYENTVLENNILTKSCNLML